MTRFARTTSDPAVMDGQPCIRWMRLTVRRVLEALATYPDREQFRAEYPEVEDEDIRQALEYAAANLDDNPKFNDILSRCRARARREGWLSTEQVRGQLAIE
jgi:uncharacterized protein (DUF433 family)